MPPPGLGARLLHWLLWRGRRSLPALLALVTALLAVPALQVEVEQDNASMTSLDRASRELYREFQESFGDDNLLLLGLHHPQLLAPAGLALLDTLSEKLAAHPRIEAVYSLSNARIPTAGPYGIEAAPLLPAERHRADFAERLAAALHRHPDQAGRLLSANRQTAALLVQPKALTGSAWQELLADLRLLQAGLSPPAMLRLSGVPVQKAEVARAIQRDQQVLIPLAVGVLALLLALIFRRISGVILPLLVMGISLTWTIGLYALAGQSLNTITALLPPVVMVLAVATTVHIYHAWLALAGETGDRRTLLAHRVAELLPPCLLTTLTTAIGLGSLTICDIPAVRSFGLFAAVGVLSAFFTAFTLGPILLSQLPLPRRQRARRHRPIRSGLRRIVRLVLDRPRLVVGLPVLLTLAALPALGRITINTDLVRFFSTESSLYRDTMALDRDLGGVAALEMMVTGVDRQPLLNPATMQHLARWEGEIRARPEVSGSFSLLDLLRPLQSAMTAPGSPELPAGDSELLEQYDLLLASGTPQLLDRVITPDLAKLRLSVQLHAIGSAPTAALAEELLAEGRQLFGDRFQLQATGNYLLLSNDSNRLVGNLMQSFLLSFALILLVLLLAFRNLQLLLVALAPNLLPLLWVGVLMGWAGIDLSTGTAMIAAVAIGLVVDDTIHFLYRYRREYAGYPRPALIRTTLGVGPALAVSTIVLGIGFWVGVFGSFRPTAYFSLLTGATLFGALFCDLLVLPAGLLLLAKRGGRTLGPLLLLLVAGIICLAEPARAEPTLPVPLDGPREDLPVRWAAIPKNPPHVGTVRLLKRGPAVVLQTDLETTVLNRVQAAIAARERARWPAGSAGHADMERYLAQLHDAVALIEHRVSLRPAGEDRRRYLQIEFIADPPRHRIVLLTREPHGPWEVFPVLTVSSHYLYGNMLAILADQLVATPAEAVAVLRPLLPAGTALPEPR